MFPSIKMFYGHNTTSREGGSSRLLVTDSRIVNLSSSLLPERMREALRLQQQQVDTIKQLDLTDQRALDPLHAYTKLAGRCSRLRQHYDAKEYYKLAHEECQRLQRGSSIVAGRNDENAPGLRVMYMLADAYHQLSKNDECNCFPLGDNCDNQRMSVTMASTPSTHSMSSKVSPEHSHSFQDETSLEATTSSNISPIDFTRKLTHWQAKAQSFPKSLYDMKSIFGCSQLEGTHKRVVGSAGRYHDAVSLLCTVPYETLQAVSSHRIPYLQSNFNTCPR